MVTTSTVRRGRRWTGLVASAAVVIVAVACGTDLGTLGGDHSGATDINDAGVVVGYSTSASGSAFHAMVIRPGQEPTALPELAGASGSYAHAINNSGTIVGTMSFAGAATRPVVWTVDGRVIDLLATLPSSLGTVRSASVNVLDDGSQVAGVVSHEQAPDSLPATSVVVWNASNGQVRLTDATTFPDLVTVRGVSRDGTVVGAIGTRPTAWIVSGTGYTAIPLSLGGGRWATAAAVNDGGTIVGSIEGRPASWAGVRAEPTLLSTPVLDSKDQVTLTGVSDTGFMVGTWTRISAGEPSLSRAIRYRPGATTYEDLGLIAEGTTARANAVNDAGVVVGEAEVAISPSGPIVHAARWDAPDA